MTLEQLRIFVAVAERQHVTQAAHDLHLSQSATSAAISALEHRYDIRFFDRIGRRVALTDAGRLFLEKAKLLLAQAADAEVLLADLADMRTGSLAVAASQTIGTYWLPRVIKTFAARCPGIGVTLELGNTEFVAERIRDGAAVLGFIEGPIDEPALAVEALFMDELALVTAPDDNWFAGGGPIEDRLRSARWIVRENGSGTRIALENALRAYGILPEDMTVALELPSNEAVRTAVEAGVGVTVLSRMAVDCALRAGMLAECRIRLAGRGFFALRHRERHQGRAAALFVDLARGGPFLCPAH